MLNVHFVLLGVACQLAGLFAYVRDTIRGTTSPNRVTWLMWGLVPMVAVAVEIHDGIGLQVLTTLVAGVGPLIVFAASFVDRKAIWKLGKLDWLCFLLSIIGVVVWVLTRQGNIALGASIGADLLAGIPTIVKSWKAPESETATGFLGSFANAVFGLLTIHEISAANFAFPFYLAVITAFELVMVAATPGPRWRRFRAQKNTALA
jgi:hypothetical protein